MGHARLRWLATWVIGCCARGHFERAALAAASISVRERAWLQMVSELQRGGARTTWSCSHSWPWPAGADIVERGMDIVAKDHECVHALKCGLHPALSYLHAAGIGERCIGLERWEPVRAHVSRPALTAQRAANCLPACRFLLRVTAYGTDLQV